MRLNRRQCLALVAGSIATHPLAEESAARAETQPQVKAIAFDAFPVFDARPIAALAERLFPENGAELSNIWRTRQFEYQWLRALGRNYADFWQATEDALVFAAALLGLELSRDKRGKLMDAYLELRAWPEVPNALEELKSAGLRLALLSNATPAILNAGINNSKLEGIFDYVLSTDRIKSYKPDQRAYRMAVDAFGLTRQEILFVAFAGWDVAGAKWFGYPTFWVNRLKSPGEELGVAADAIGSDLNDLVSFVNRYGRSSPHSTPGH